MNEIMKGRISRLNEAIQKSGLSYSELQSITGIAKSSIQRYATFKTEKIPIDNLEKLAAATGVSIEYIMGWTEEKNSAFISEDKNAVIERIINMPEDRFQEMKGKLQFAGYLDPEDE